MQPSAIILVQAETQMFLLDKSDCYQIIQRRTFSKINYNYRVTFQTPKERNMKQPLVI